MLEQNLSAAYQQGRAEAQKRKKSPAPYRIVKNTTSGNWLLFPRSAPEHFTAAPSFERIIARYDDSRKVGFGG